MSSVDLSKVSEIIVDSGNLNTGDMLRRNLSRKSSEEALIGLQNVIAKWKSGTDLKSIVKDQVLMLCNDSNTSIPFDEQDQLSLVIKVFVYEQNDSTIEEAIRSVLNHSRKSVADSVIIALPPLTSGKTSQRSIEELLQMWTKVENVAKQQFANEFGVSDLNLEQLKAIVSNAKEVRPSTNHINLEYCCAISPEMSQYAEENQIRLVTHNDPKG